MVTDANDGPRDSGNTTNYLSDLRGLTLLLTEATVGVTEVVEEMHHNILRQAWLTGRAPRGPMGGVTGLVYRNIRLVTGIVGGSLHGVLRKLEPMAPQGSNWPGREAFLAALNGVLGDAMAARENPLTLEMALRHEGRTLELEKQALTAAMPKATGKLLVLVHGLCLNDEQWLHHGHDHGTSLQRDLGYSPVYLRYNSGLHVSQNGHTLADLLETLVNEWPVPLEELVLLCHSMGGQVSRSACHYAREADHGWVNKLQSLIFLGTPHHGAPLEKVGNWVHQVIGISPYSAPLARLARIRSAGITDLRHGSLLDEEWQGLDRFDAPARERLPVPLPPAVSCHFLAATTSLPDGAITERLQGDGLVLVHSALGRHEQAALNLSRPDQRWVGHGINHMDLLSSDIVYQQIRRILAQVKKRGDP